MNTNASRAFFSCKGSELASLTPDQLNGFLLERSGGVEGPQRFAWTEQLICLKPLGLSYQNATFFWEFQIPRIGRRADIVMLESGVVIVLEFKAGSRSYEAADKAQAMDYALDLKNFHSGSHELDIIPILVSTKAPELSASLHFYSDRVADTVCSNSDQLVATVERCLANSRSKQVDPEAWENSPYKPTPTIIEAAQTLYREHSVEDLARSDAGQKNLSLTSDYIKNVVSTSKLNGKKSICFVTGVPGSGKTLAGLNIATELMSASEDDQSVFLSGNGPLVDVLREALTRDDVERARLDGQRLNKKEAGRKAEAFIQNIHHFRDDSLTQKAAPINKVVVFDEAQRAWNATETEKHMRMKKNVHDFDMSEPGFLLSVMDRHEDWCTVICLIGGGQEINRGEAGLGEWFTSLIEAHRDWDVHISDALSPKDYLSAELQRVPSEWFQTSDLHLDTSIRSFRAEHVSGFVNQLLDGDVSSAAETVKQLTQYPMVITRDIKRAKDWVRTQRRGSERSGILASSNGIRLRPHGINVKVSIDPKAWMLNGFNDVRSSDALEEPATEFDVQGLEIDWAIVCWDANLRYSTSGWESWRFKGTRWQRIKDTAQQSYLRNAYRVLLSRARQGFVVFIPNGDDADDTRPNDFYNPTYEALVAAGLEELDQPSKLRETNSQQRPNSND